MNSGPSTTATEAIIAALPLRVDEVHLSDPVITLTGDEWSLTVWCPFRVTGLDFGWDSEDLEDRVWDLIGYSIQDFATRADGPVFGFGDGVELILEEGDDGEPWVLKIPGRILTAGTRSPHWS